MTRRKNAGTMVVLLTLLLLSILIYDVPALKDFFFSLPLIVELAVILAAILLAAALASAFKRWRKKGGK
jgi:hypothetical protein